MISYTDRDDDTDTRMLAYELWEQAGRPDGQDMEFWDRASRMIADRAVLGGKDQAEPHSLARIDSRRDNVRRGGGVDGDRVEPHLRGTDDRPYSVDSP